MTKIKSSIISKINVFFVLLLAVIFLTSCSVIQRKPRDEQGNVKDTSELWSKAMTSRAIIERSGTTFKSAQARDSGLAMKDAKNRLMTGGGLLGQKVTTDMLTKGKIGSESGMVAGMGMPINPFIWRASLEAVNFIPLSSADPFGGIIITDWHSEESNLSERCKVNIFIKGAELTANNLKASIFCEELSSGTWVSKAVDGETNLAFEDAILEKAIRLRISN